MSKEYNSILLGKLFSDNSTDETIEILEEIAEIADPIFIHPLYEAYKKNTHSHISHYFFSALSKIQSADVIDICFEILEEHEISVTDKSYILEIFEKANLYDEKVIKIAVSTLNQYIKEQYNNEYTLYSIISFFEKAGILNQIKNELIAIFLDKKFNSKSRIHSLGKWFEIDAKKNIQEIIDDFEEIKKDKEKEVLIAKTIITWSGSKIDELKNIIKKTGSPEARHIIEQAEKKSKEKEAEKTKKQNKKIQQAYNNADLVEKIISLRGKINTVAKANDRINFPIFPQNELIHAQSKQAVDEITLIKACGDLRGIIQELNKDLSSHGLELEDIKKLLPYTAEEDFGKSINKLHLYLSAKKFKIDKSAFGLRNINQLVGLLGAHSSDEKDKLIKKLEEFKFKEMYLQEEWSLLHREILKKYITSLENILNSISEE